MDLDSASNEQHDAAAPFLTLPESVLVKILKKVPQHDRLSRAALVCKAWAAAAAAATTVITLKRVNAATAAGLSSWLQQHGRGAVEAIRVPTNRNDLVQIQLPCDGLAKLCILHLHNCALQFSTSSTSSRVGAQARPAIVLPALYSLIFNRCTQPLATASHLECPRLKILQVYPSFDDRPSGSRQQLEAALSSLLQRLPELTLLGLEHDFISDAPLAQLSCLQKLQQCSLSCPQVSSAVLANLTSGLKHLALISGNGVLQERDLPAAGLPHLKQLQVSNHAMQPAVLSRLTALQQLELSHCSLHAYPDRPYYTRQASDGTAQLLGALAPLTNLRRLDPTDILLEPVPTDGNGNGAPQPAGAAAAGATAAAPSPRLAAVAAAVAGAVAAAEAAAEAAAAERVSPFSALTASSVLESLTLAYRSTEEGGDPLQPLPMGAVAAMFPPGRQLTALTELVLDGMDPELVADLEEDEEWDLDHDPFNMDTCMTSSDQPLLLDACPTLQRLTLNSVLPRWCAQLYSFLNEAKDGLPQLTYLCLGGLCLTNDDAPGIASITRLRELELHNAPELGPDGLGHLTELRQLSRLHLHGVGHRRCLDALLVSTSKTDQPNVWQQLQLTLPGLREQQWAMRECLDYDSEGDPYDSYDEDDDYTDSSDEGCVGRRGMMCAGYW